jgi:outer membrane lipase/esterase
MRSSHRLLLLALSLPNLFIAQASAQTLDQQYEYYLQTASPPGITNDQKCLRLGFERTGATIVAGQAGPNLFGLCSGFPDLPQGSNPAGAAVSGGAAGASVSRSGRSNDAALRRRRDNARAEENETASLTSLRGGAASSDSESLFANGGVFFSYDYRDEEQSITYYEDGRDAERTTLTLGADYRFGSTLLAGVALSLDELAGDFDSGGEFETNGYSASLYGSWLPIDNLFVDFSAGYDTKDIDTTRIVGRTVYFLPIGQTEPQERISVPYSQVNGKTDGDTMKADLSAGYDFQLSRFTVGPRLGAMWANTTTDAYKERGESAMTLAFDEQKEASLITSAGLQASAAFTFRGIVIVPQLNANWLHESRGDQRVIVARFAEDLRATPVRFGFLNEPPDRDVYTARFSVVGVFAHGVSAFIAAEQLFAHDYREQFGASIGLRWEM